MCLSHEFRVKTYKALCMIHGFPAGLVNSVHNDFIKLYLVNAGLALDTARCRITSRHGSVIKQKNLGILLKSEGVSVLDRHVRHDCSGGILR